MFDYNALMDVFLGNLKKMFYPQEWIDLDLSFSKSEIFAMLLIDRHGEVIMSKLADDINVPMSTATGVIERLVKIGYVQRERSESDRRIVVIRLTEEGKDLVNSIKAKISHYIEAINDGLTEEEKQLAGKIILKVIQLVNQENQPQEGSAPTSGQIKKIDIE